MADTCILRGRTCDPRMWITRVSSGTTWSVVLLRYPGQGQTEVETGVGGDRGIERGSSWGLVQREGWKGHREQLATKFNSVAWAEESKQKVKIFIKTNHFHYNNLWIMNLICRFSKQQLGFIPNSVTRSWNSLKSMFSLLCSPSIAPFFPFPSISESLVQPMCEYGFLHPWSDWLSESNQSKTWLSLWVIHTHSSQ